MNPYIILVIACLSFGFTLSGQTHNLSTTKLFIENDTVYYPFNTNVDEAFIYTAHRDSLLISNFNKRVIPVKTGRSIHYRIKFSVFNDYFVGHTFNREARDRQSFYNNMMSTSRMSALSKADNIKFRKAFETYGSNPVYNKNKLRGNTRMLFNAWSEIEANRYLDFTAIDNTITFSLLVNNTLEIWNYEIDEVLLKEKGLKEVFRDVEPTLVLKTELDEPNDFISFYIKGKLFIAAFDGTVYKVKKKKLKVVKSIDKFNHKTIIIDKDNDEVWEVFSNYIEHELPFQVILEKYGKRLRL